MKKKKIIIILIVILILWTILVIYDYNRLKESTTSSSIKPTICLFDDGDEAYGIGYSYYDGTIWHSIGDGMFEVNWGTSQEHFKLFYCIDICQWHN